MRSCILSFFFFLAAPPCKRCTKERTRQDQTRWLPDTIQEFAGRSIDLIHSSICHWNSSMIVLAYVWEKGHYSRRKHFYSHYPSGKKISIYLCYFYGCSCKEKKSFKACLSRGESKSHKREYKKERKAYFGCHCHFLFLHAIKKCVCIAELYQELWQNSHICFQIS